MYGICFVFYCDSSIVAISHLVFFLKEEEMENFML